MDLKAEVVEWIGSLGWPYSSPSQGFYDLSGLCAVRGSLFVFLIGVGEWCFHDIFKNWSTKASDEELDGFIVSLGVIGLAGQFLKL